MPQQGDIPAKVLNEPLMVTDKSSELSGYAGCLGKSPQHLYGVGQEMWGVLGRGSERGLGASGAQELWFSSPLPGT